MWTTGAIAMRDYGTVPSSLDVFLLLVGAVAGFGAVAVCAAGVRGNLRSAHGNEFRLWAALHLPAVGSSIALVTAASHLVDGRAIWPLVGMIGTAAYLLVAGLQFSLARR